MTQIFISYSRQDRAVAQQLAGRLNEAGYDVWWDAAITGGQRFEDEIQSALRTASAVLILWSKASTASDWVRAEAEVARVARTAVPILIDDVSIDGVPLVFRALHTIDLRGWTGDTAADGFRDVLGAVAKLGANAGPSRAAPPSHYPQPMPPKPRTRRWPLISAVAALVLVIAAGLGWWVLHPTESCAPGSRITAPSVPMTLCLVGQWVPTGTTPFQYNSADGKVQFRLVDATTVISAEVFRTAIVQNAQRIAGDPSRIAVVKEGGLTVAGQPWRYIEFTNQGQAAFVNFYYSALGFGDVQLLFVSSVADVADRNALATPILNSVQLKPN